VAEHPRIEELRRRIQKDPASIAFAQLAEEYRRAGRLSEAIETCRAGLAYHPDYLSAHVTLGRALLETGELLAAEEALSRVHAAAPENLAAIKGLADIHHRRGESEAALALYTRAIQLGPHDSELEHLIGVLQEEAAAASPQAADVAPVATAPAPVPDDDRLLAEAFEAAPPLAAPSPAPGLPAAQDPHLPDPTTPQQVEALERWLDTILADREGRQ
jgi:tetratricopeptide (TPR) repeat protein